ncbi:hypothetical protein CC80DRAFT_541564 [Byssothecium circinans]|uniref:CBF1-interacting co-repressor CIR N-terminal domain-containing protein n=1 Tax=Byssothecium circinans TaxID=147558 RepID=A0A6A5URD8_9PLEO|nr:hypothetical protein CC80DRAFT_541564 [Byssothecium circinans]
MPLHLLGKKSWNVYNSANIARVKADEAAAAAREAAEDERQQEIDAARRVAILRGETPPPLPGEDTSKHEKTIQREGHERKRRKLFGEDDTDMDIRLATSATAPKEGIDRDAKLLKLRKPDDDAPLADHAGNISLFPVDTKEIAKREKNEEAEKDKRKKERALEDQYTMRFSNAAGRGGLEQQPWYTTGERSTTDPSNNAGAGAGDKSLEHVGFSNKDVWGNEDPRRKEREQARITSNDPFAFMQKAQVQLKKSKNDKKKWADERERELRELRATQERESRRDRHGKRKKRERVEEEGDPLHLPGHSGSRNGDRDSKQNRYRHRHRHHRSRSRSRERGRDHGSGLSVRSRSRSQDRAKDRYVRKSSSRHEPDGREYGRNRHSSR